MNTQRAFRLNPGQRLGLGGVALLAVGIAGGAGAVSMTRPTVAMAPTVPTAISHLSDARGIVSVRGRVAEVFGDRFIVQDATGRALVDAGPGGETMQLGSAILVQGRFDQGQLHARYLVDASGTVREVGPPPPPPHGPGHRPPPPGGPDRPGEAGRADGPPPPPPGADAGPAPADGVAPPPPPPAGSASAGADAPAPAPATQPGGAANR